MNRPKQSSRGFDRGAIRLPLLGAALAASALLAACNRTEPVVPAVPAVPVFKKEVEQKFDPATANPRPVLWPKPVPKEDEPLAAGAREQVIRRDADAIRAECRRAAGGDWERWQHDTAPYRLALKAKLDALKPLASPKVPLAEFSYEALEGKNGFPLFETGAREHLYYLHEPKSLDAFRKDRPVLAAHRWLREKGIDLIFVPVPKLLELYVEHFLDPCPADGVIAPHVRRNLLEMLETGVEVVDGFPLYRSQRDTDAEYLYNTADSHWSPRGMRVMAKEVADRILRYKFGARARYGIPIMKTELAPYGFPLAPGEDPRPGVGSHFGWSTLSYEQQQRAAKAQTTAMAHVTLLDGREPYSSESPVVVIGNSFVPYFQEQLAKELNLPLNSRWLGAATTEQFADFVREPELLKNCRVLVWVSTERHLPNFRPLPPPIAAYADAK